VAALLRRQVFLPLQEITEFASNVKRGNLTQKLSGTYGELTELADSVRTVASGFGKAVQEDTKPGEGNTAVQADVP